MGIEAGTGPENLTFSIGVTGHRDLRGDDLSEIRETVRSKLVEIRNRFNNAEVTVVSGLAEGADTLVAEVALELHLPVHAVLPMPREYYAADFEGAALEEFEALLNRDGVTITEIPVAEGSGPEKLKTSEGRTVQYGLLMDFIKRRSNIVMALWDGLDAELTAGTSDVVLGYLAASNPNRPALMASDMASMDSANDIVCWIPVARASGDASRADAETGYLVSNSEGDCYWPSAEIPDVILSRWNGFDEFAHEYASDFAQTVTTYPLLPDKVLNKNKNAQAVETIFQRADQLAQGNQGYSDRLFQVFALIAALMGLFFLIYAKLLAAKWLLAGYIALFFAGYIGFSVSRRKKWLAKHLSYRALAETLRVQFWLTLSQAGRKYDIRHIMKLLNVTNFERFDWLQDAVRAGEQIYGDDDAEMENIRLTCENWVKDQAGYFKRKLHDLHKRHHLLERVKAVLLAGSVLGALALIYFKKQLLHLEMAGYDGKAWLVFLMGLLPLWVAIWELYQGKMATRELIWQYANQERVFSMALGPLSQSTNREESRRIIADLADKALIEIYLWSVHRYHREHEPPAAG